MTSPSQNPEAAGLETAGHVVWWKAGGVNYYPEGEAFTVSESYRVEPLVTAASAQARIGDLESRLEYLRISRDGHAAHAHSEFEARVAAEARADRLAKVLEPFARVARWARLCGMSDLEKATAKYAKRNLFWDQFSAADAALHGDADHAG